MQDDADAQSGVASIGTKSITVREAGERPDIDGRLATGEWDDAVRVDDLHQTSPVEFDAPSQRTVFFIKYTSSTIYVAVYAYDSNPSGIVATAARQGAALWNDDNVGFLIDPFNNKRSGYSFELNPNGIRADAIYTGGTNSDDDWEGVWTGAARIVEDGWTAEFAIPVKTISFDPNQSTWGINFWRNIERNGERISWSSFNGRTNPTTSGEISGIRDLSQGFGLDLIPTFSATHAIDHPASSSESDMQPSLDAIYKITPNWTVTGTINTDFAATEADGRQLDLGRFSPSFPEKRSFFLTDFDIFSFGGGGRATGIGASDSVQPFYSRQIGAGDIIGGLKLAGRIGNYDIGTLVMRQDAYTNSRGREIEATDIVVTRILRPVLTESTLGVLATYGDPNSNDESSTIALDFSYQNDRLPGGRELESLIWLQKTNNPDVSDDDMAWNMQVSLPSRQGWTAGAQYLHIQENFDPRLGQNRRDTGTRFFSTGASYKWILSGSAIRDVSTSLSTSRWEYLDTGEVQSADINFQMLNLQTPAGDRMGLSVSRETENLRDGERRPLSSLGIDIPYGEYDYVRWSLFLNSSGARAVSGRLNANFGDYYNGRRWGISPSLSWRVNRLVTVELGYNYTSYEGFPSTQQFTTVKGFDDPVPVQNALLEDVYSNDKKVVRQVDLELDLVFTASLSVNTTIDYDNVSEDFGLNSRLRWNLAPGQDVWFVVSHNVADDFADDLFPTGIDHPVYGYEYADFDQFGEDSETDYHDVSTNFAFKIRYTHRF